MTSTRTKRNSNHQQPKKPLVDHSKGKDNLNQKPKIENKIIIKKTLDDKNLPIDANWFVCLKDQRPKIQHKSFQPTILPQTTPDNNYHPSFLVWDFVDVETDSFFQPLNIPHTHTHTRNRHFIPPHLPQTIPPKKKSASNFS